ncbi:MAG: hypothetical protein AMJ42_03475 [Deltaproteobacteria bacterium DG_8]|nr:MAG: hypothetical protein AMJ42_03475 [Deltaproteobacteria bacterium DG_8]
MNLKIPLSLLIFREERIFMDNFDNNEKVGIERRRHRRYNIPAAISCKLFQKNLEVKNSFQGFIQNISFGGVSLEIRDDFLIINDSFLKYTNIEIALELNMPDGIQKINISGIIRWYRRVKRKNMNLLYLGIQFFNLAESDKDILKKYLSLGTGDQNLIWNLWDKLSIQP